MEPSASTLRISFPPQVGQMFLLAFNFFMNLKRGNEKNELNAPNKPIKTRAEPTIERYGALSNPVVAWA